MMAIPLRSQLKAAFVFGCLVAGCSEGGGDDAGNQGRIDVIPQGPGGENPKVLFGTVREFQVAGSDAGSDTGAEGPIIAGVEICQLDTDNCVHSNSQGNYNIEVRPDPDGSLIFRMEGYAGAIVPASIGLDDIRWLTVTLAPDSVMQSFVERLGTPWPNDARGIILFYSEHEEEDPETGVIHIVWRQGVTLELARGEGGVRYYADASGLPDSSLTETTLSGWGGFVEVEPGDVEIAFAGGPNEECTPGSSFAGSVEGTVRGPVRGGAITVLGVQCH